MDEQATPQDQQSSPLQEALGGQPKIFKEKDASLVAAVLQKAVQTLKDTLGEDFFCDHVTLGIQIDHEKKGFDGVMATKYMTMGVTEEQYLNLACYLTYMVGIMRSNKPEDIGANCKIAAKEVKHRVNKYHEANPYIPQEEDEAVA